MNKPFGVCLQPVLRLFSVLAQPGENKKKKRSVANGGLKSVSALLKKLSGPLIVLRLQAQTNKK